MVLKMVVEKDRLPQIVQDFEARRYSPKICTKGDLGDFRGHLCNLQNLSSCCHSSLF